MKFAIASDVTIFRRQAGYPRIKQSKSSHIDHATNERQVAGTVACLDRIRRIVRFFVCYIRLIRWIFRFSEHLTDGKVAGADRYICVGLDHASSSKTKCAGYHQVDSALEFYISTISNRLRILEIFPSQ